MVENTYRRYPRRVRRPAPQGGQNTTLFIAGGLIGGLLIVLLVAMGEPTSAERAVKADTANGSEQRTAQAHSPVATTTAPTTTAKTPTPTPKVQKPESNKPAAVETKPAAEAKPAVNTKAAAPVTEPKRKLVADVPEPKRPLFPSSGISPLSHLIPGPEGQEAKADKIVRVVVDDLQITRASNGKLGYSLTLRRTGFLKGQQYGSNKMRTFTIDPANGDPCKEFGLAPATAKGKKLVLFLKDDKSGGGSFSFFGLTNEDYTTLKSKVTAEAR